MEGSTEDTGEIKNVTVMNEKFTGLKDTDLLILERLDDKDLLHLCIVNKAINRNCQDESFWRKRFIKNFNNERKEVILDGFSNVPSKYKTVKETWRNFYLKFVHYTHKYTVSGHLMKHCCFTGDMSLVVYGINKLKSNGGILNNETVYLSLSNQGNYYDIMKYLILNGISPNVPDDNILVWVCSYGPYEMVKFLVDHGSNVNIQESAALRWAAKQNRFDVIKYLIEHGANIHSRNEEALTWAARNNNLEMLEYLMGKGADANIENEKPLRWAATNGHYEIVEYLIKKGANVNALSPEGETALKKAQTNGHSKIVDFLIHHGAK